MSFVSRAKELFWDFLFPKDGKVLELESLSPGKLLDILLPAEKAPDGEFIALFEYDFPLAKEMIWELKYSGNRRIAEKLGEILYDALVQETSERSLEESAWLNRRPLLVPIPISERRRFERGWNQAELLCEAIKKSDVGEHFKYIPRQLVKNRHTESQTKTSSKRERLENLKDSMRVQNMESVSGRCVIIIDDVTTTGATFNEARRALRAAGAKKILCVAVAH